MKALTDSERIALFERRWDSADLFAYSFPLRFEYKYIYAYVLLVGKRTGNIAYVKNFSLLYMQT